ncbi:protein ACCUMULATION AND REPLICATION OF CHLOROPLASTS 3, chloroplastic [Corylus avellana]|uniref:protein ACCUMULATION AND REPLICATION OF CHLOROPLASTS 3, chloroplastic n=1 Tax=Corylus avellana TaxID=13451 RepID=UPI00286CB96C|nr:protein ACCUMULATION AND REPLICATION OF CHLOROPLASTS 3, chloroplastic [Corylus avellana]
MELPVFTSFQSVSRTCLCPHFSNRIFYGGSRKYGARLKFRSTSKRCLRVTMSLDRDYSSNGYDEGEVNDEDIWGDTDFVEVIGIGSRKDAVLDFCLCSPFKSSSMRFWSILMKDSMKGKLQQKFLEKDLTPRILEAPLSIKLCRKAIILVASAGYGLDHIAAVDILRTIKSANGFTIVVILKPFSFEGQRRQEEVKHLVGNLREHTNLFIDVDTDMLLRKDLVTLDEAVKTANNAVLLAVNAISVLISETHRKLIDVAHNDVKEVQVSELIEILESYKEAKVGFGAGYNAKTSILQSLYDCPFLGVGVKDLNGVVICILASSNAVDKSDAFLRTFRQTTEYAGSIILSLIHEPNLEPNLLLTTVLIVGDTRQQSSQKSSILSTLARHIPFVFDLLRRHHPHLNGTEGNHLQENAFLYEERDSGDSHDGGNGIDVNNIAEDNDQLPENFQTVGSSNDNEFYASRNYDSESDESEVGLSETSAKSSRFYNAISEGTPAFQREPLMSWNLRPAYEIAKEWAKERAADTGTTSLIHNLSILRLPVGVRPSVELKDNANISLTTQNLDPETEGDAKAEPVVNSSVSSWSGLTDAGFEAVKDFCNNTFTSFKGEYVDITKKQGDLSVRAASMLEAERDSPKKWSPIVEMPYRGGFYRGRCQGGLPEGKGRLVLGDASIYDGIWHYGKRSGLGTFYFSNGDVFQGSWREDVMHGKGWFYFHTGDRWFANFWKGKANGEGRFYSKSGDVFFGHFQDGWRHGQFLCIDINGTRSLEIWDQGILVSCKQLDSDTDAG